MSAHLEVLERPKVRLSRWIVAAAVVFSMHATAGTLALVEWQEEEVAESEEGAFMLELAPTAMAPPAEQLNVAIGPASDETPASAAATEETKETPEAETPEVAESPLAPSPEVVVQKQQEVIEKTEEPEQKEEQPADNDVTDQATSVPQETRRPPPVEAPPAATALAPKQGLSSKPSQATLSWQRSLALHLNKHKQYPAEARRAGAEGIVRLWLSLDRSGRVIESHIVKSSGSSHLDREAMEVLIRASPFPQPPSHVADLAFDFIVPIQFQIGRR